LQPRKALALPLRRLRASIFLRRRNVKRVNTSHGRTLRTTNLRRVKDRPRRHEHDDRPTVFARNGGEMWRLTGHENNPTCTIIHSMRFGFWLWSGIRYVFPGLAYNRLLNRDFSHPDFLFNSDRADYLCIIFALRCKTTGISHSLFCKF
jgi:hypothetical protein